MRLTLDVQRRQSGTCTAAPIGIWSVSLNPQAEQDSAYHSACGRAERSTMARPAFPQAGQATNISGRARQAAMLRPNSRCCLPVSATA